MSFVEYILQKPMIKRQLFTRNVKIYCTFSHTGLLLLFFNSYFRCQNLKLRFHRTQRRIERTVLIWMGMLWPKCILQWWSMQMSDCLLWKERRLWYVSLYSPFFILQFLINDLNCIYIILHFPSRNASGISPTSTLFLTIYLSDLYGTFPQTCIISKVLYKYNLFIIKIFADK